MNDVFDTYGVDASSLDDARHLLETMLGVVFERHDSDAIGGVYYRAAIGRGTIRLLRNWNSVEQVWNEARWPEHALVAYLSKTDDPDGLRTRLTSSPEVRHLWRDIVPSRRRPR